MAVYLYIIETLFLNSFFPKVISILFFHFLAKNSVKAKAIYLCWHHYPTAYHLEHSNNNIRVNKSLPL